MIVSISGSLESVVALAPPTAFEFASENIPVEWVESSLAATGSASLRRRKLPADVVVWLVIGMALFRDRSITAVVAHLDLAEDRNSPDGHGTVDSSTISQARARLGSEPMKHLFALTSSAWAFAAADKDRWNGLAVYALDGSSLRVADTDENDKHFGRPASGRGVAGYPQARIVALDVPRSHLLAGFAVGPWSTSEAALADQLWGELPDDSVVTIDRNFLAYGKLHRLQQAGTNRHWLIRAKKNTRWKVVTRLGDGDDLVELNISSKARKEDPSLPRVLRARAVRYQRPGFQPQTLLTSLLDPKAYPAQQVSELYHERWEIEMGFDEKKTHMLERKESTRSKTVQGTLQEIWGIAIAYNIVRTMMLKVSERKGVEPRRISFWNSLLIIRNFLVSAWAVAPGSLPRLIDLMMRDIGVLLLPERRFRSNPRHVKIKMSNYKKKPARIASKTH